MGVVGLAAAARDAGLDPRRAGVAPGRPWPAGGRRGVRRRRWRGLVHAGVDWDWELTSVSVWMFGLAGLALARRETAAGRGARDAAAAADRGGAGLPRARARAVGAVALAGASRRRPSAPSTAATARQTVDSALDSLGALGARAEPWELIAYCDVRLGQPKLAEGAAKAAIAPRPGRLGVPLRARARARRGTRKDPRAAAAEARRLNPLEGLAAQDAVKAFRTDRPAAWERRARRLPLYLN